MRTSDLDRLMTASLDGEATPDESAALERALAGDPSLRQRYEAWQRLFAALDRVPAPHPPEGLVAAVMANIPAAGRPSADQLPSPSPVFGVGSNPFSLGGTMTDKTSGSFNKRKLVLGVGLAAIAVVVIGYSLDMPPGSKDTIGTILPAERFIKQEQISVNILGKCQCRSFSRIEHNPLRQGDKGLRGSHFYPIRKRQASKSRITRARSLEFVPYFRWSEDFFVQA